MEIQIPCHGQAAEFIEIGKMSMEQKRLEIYPVQVQDLRIIDISSFILVDNPENAQVQRDPGNKGSLLCYDDFDA